MRFPWKDGRHPWLDVGMESATTLIGIESRRYEPFRPAKASGFAEVGRRPRYYADGSDALVLRRDFNLE